MKKIVLLFMTILTLHATPSVVTDSQTENLTPPSSKSVDMQTRDAGAMLAVVGISFMIIDVLVSGFTILGVGGVVFFISGAVMFFGIETFSESSLRSLIIAFSIVSVGFFILAVRQFLTSKSAKIVTGSEEIIGSIAKVVEVKEDGVQVLCHGEIWSAISQSELAVGQRVEVTELSGLILNVKPIKE